MYVYSVKNISDFFILLKYQVYLDTTSVSDMKIFLLENLNFLFENFFCHYAFWLTS